MNVNGRCWHTTSKIDSGVLRRIGRSGAVLRVDGYRLKKNKAGKGGKVVIYKRMIAIFIKIFLKISK